MITLKTWDELVVQHTYLAVELLAAADTARVAAEAVLRLLVLVRTVV